MKIPFLDLRQQYIELQDELNAAALQALDSGWYILGRQCLEFETAFSHYLSGEAGGFVVGVNSGTDALKLSLLAAGIRPGDEVITVATTAIPTAVAICSIGAVPVFCDVDPDTWLLNPALIESYITERTRAIIPVHLYGSACEMGAILAVAKQYRLAVIEDVAQATGAMWNGQQCGTIGDFGAFSFYPSKNLGACGDGGAIFVRTSAQRDLLLKLRNYGQSGRYLADTPGGENSRLDEIQAALLSVKLRHMEQWNEKRRSCAQFYRAAIKERNLPVSVQSEYDGACSANHLFVVALPSGQRDHIMERMAEKDVQTLIHYPHPLYQQPAFAIYRREANPVAERLCASVLSLPFHPYLGESEIQYVVDCLAESFESL